MGIIVALIIGVVMGIFTMAMCTISGDADKCSECIYERKQAMKYYVKILDWRAENFKLVRERLGLSKADVLDMMRGPYELEDVQDSELMDAYISVKDELASVYNELLIASGLEYRFQSTYVLFDKLPPKPEV